MEHEETYDLMMEALDGELAEDERRTLEAHLRACPECEREWQGVLAIHTLFLQTPALSPMAGFTGRTLARLPNRRARIWAVGAVYALLLLSGLFSLLLIGWAVAWLAPFVRQPDLAQTVVNSLMETSQVMGAIFSALLSGLGKMIAEQPTLIGWLLVMLGTIFLWGGVYRQLIGSAGKSEFGKNGV